MNIRFIKIIDLCVSVTSSNIHPPQARSLPLSVTMVTLRDPAVKHKACLLVCSCLRLLLNPHVKFNTHLNDRGENRVSSAEGRRKWSRSPPSPSFLLYSFGSEKSQRDMIQTLSSSPTHNRVCKNHDNGFSYQNKMVTAFE